MMYFEDGADDIPDAEALQPWCCDIEPVSGRRQDHGEVTKTGSTNVWEIQPSHCFQIQCLLTYHPTEMRQQCVCCKQDPESCVATVLVIT